MELDQPFSEEEILSAKDRYNEYVMTGLRTIWGLQESNLKQFDASIYTYFKQQVKPFLESKKVSYDGQSYRLSKEARLQADGIASELFAI
jgi:oxygen-independent coproporphyrinogen-3 oxidase